MLLKYKYYGKDKITCRDILLERVNTLTRHISHPLVHIILINIHKILFLPFVIAFITPPWYIHSRIFPIGNKKLLILLTFKKLCTTKQFSSTAEICTTLPLYFKSGQPRNFKYVLLFDDYFYNIAFETNHHLFPVNDETPPLDCKDSQFLTISFWTANNACFCTSSFL